MSPTSQRALFAQKPEIALSEYKLALDLLERHSGPEVALYRARALRGAADIYAFQLQDPKRAVEVYRELIATCPEAPETMEGRLHLAELLRHEFRDIRAAIAELTAALTRNPPQSAELAYKVATLYFELRDYQQVTIEADAVIRKYEASAWVDDALYLKGQALSMMDGRQLEAQRAYTELVDRFPDSQLKPHALVELGRIKVDQGESERAIEYWVESLKTHPDPKVVQTAIARVRAHLRATTPDAVGEHWNERSRSASTRQAQAASIFPERLSSGRPKARLPARSCPRDALQAPTTRRKPSSGHLRGPLYPPSAVPGTRTGALPPPKAVLGTPPRRLRPAHAVPGTHRTGRRGEGSHASHPTVESSARTSVRDDALPHT